MKLIHTEFLEKIREDISRIGQDKLLKKEFHLDKIKIFSEKSSIRE